MKSRVTPSLAERNYRVVGHGLSGITWRREMSGRVIAGLVVLGLFALAGLASGDPGSVVFGLLCVSGAGLLVYFRRPATVTITLAGVRGGTELTVIGGPDAKRAERIAKTVAGPPPTEPPPGKPEAPGSLWGPPRP